MYKILISLLCFVLGIIVGLNLFNRYDVNRDNKVDATDYVQVKNYIMEE